MLLYNASISSVYGEVQTAMNDDDVKPATARRIAMPVLWLLLCTPLVLALFHTSAADTASIGALLNWAGRLTGIAGLTCMLLSAALIVRVPGFDRLFGGLTKLWMIHHRLGAAALLLLLAHPLLLAFAAANVSLAAATATLLPPAADWPTWLGWLALLVMMAFLAPTFAFFGEPDYQRWKWMHRLSGLAVLLAIVHTLMLTRSLPETSSRAVWLGLAMLAVFAVLYRFVFSRHVGRLRYSVSAVAHPANNVVELTLEPDGRSLDYRPGQFVYLTPRDRSLAAGHAEEHPYTLSSAPEEPALRVAVKDLGDASRALQQVALGTPVQIEGPYGDFFPDRVGRELWIAGGIGITPFLSRARHIAATGGGTDVQLIFCVQDESRALFLKELQQLADSIEGFNVTMHFFYREGPLTAEFIEQHCQDVALRSVYICGPTPLITLARNLLPGSGVRQDRIQTEEFALL